MCTQLNNLYDNVMFRYRDILLELEMYLMDVLIEYFIKTSIVVSIS